MVLRGFTTIWSLATLPTRSSPFSEIATTLGRMSAPLSLGTTFAILLRTYATHVFVVPRSIPRRMGFSAISFRLEELSDATVRGGAGARKPRLAGRLPPHPVTNGRTCGAGLRHLGRTPLAAHAALLEDELQRSLQDVVGGLGRIRAVETRQHHPRPGRLRGVREGDPAGDEGEEAVQVLEHHGGRLPEQQEGHAQDGANHGGPQVLRADAPELDRQIAARDGQERRLQLVDVHRGNPAEPARRLVTELARARRDALQHLGLVAAFVDEIEDVAEERAEALPGRIARAGRGRGGLHARTLARGKQRP